MRTCEYDIFRLLLHLSMHEDFFYLLLENTFYFLQRIYTIDDTDADLTQRPLQEITQSRTNNHFPNV